MRQLRRLVEREVRRADHGDRRRTGLGRIGGERDRVGCRLRAAVGSDVEPAGSCLDEQAQATPPLLDREEDSLAVRAEREHAVEPGCHVWLDERAERLVVESALPRPGAASPQRRAFRAARASFRRRIVRL